MTERLARVAWSVLLWCLQPLYVLRLHWRARAEPAYAQAIPERFGWGVPTPPGAVWLHAVSLGETRAAVALVEALRARHPDVRLLLTHGTATGREAGAALLGDGDAQVWLPVDTPGATARFFVRHRPALGILMETEIWPNLLAAAERHGVPVVLANARLSERSARRGARVRALLGPATARLALVLAQAPADAQRLRAAGARDVRVCGNLKFDLTPEPALLDRGGAWARTLTRQVVLFAISREGEESMLLAAWSAVPQPRPLLVIVPRHPQRFDEVAQLVQSRGFTLSRRSSWANGPDAAALAADVWLGDSMREMPAYYALADVALLGGSFAPLGGQNLIEAAACGCPVVMGPYTFNFAQAAELARAAGAAFEVSTMEAAVATALGWLQDSPSLAARAGRARAFAAEHRGAARRMAEAMDAWLPGQSANRPTNIAGSRASP